jgi:hypothetical protein
MRRLLVLVAWLAVGCASGLPSQTTGPSDDASAPAQLAMCDNVRGPEAPADWYRDATIAMEGEESPGFVAVTGWARQQPGFQELWIDRANHDGWLTLAFSQDAEARQHDLIAAGFADNKVVAVGVPWTMAQMEDLRQRVFDSLRLRVRVFGVSFYPQLGIVRAEIYFLKPDLVEALNAQFAGQPVCIDGVDPGLAPIEGPQQPSGNVWRLLADEDQTGDSYRTAVAYDDASYADLWAAAGISGAPRAVDFQSEIVIWFGAVHGSSCPRMRLDDVVVEPDRPLVHAQITHLDFGVCTMDAIPHAYVVALARSQLPSGPFAIQLGEDDPPAGVPEERTVVGADLSQPGSVAEPGDITRGGPVP